ncbi:argonaute-like protein [Cubamyces menziesii]|nr:argonaute-like protein [Cubamyces menziesii]
MLSKTSLPRQALHRRQQVYPWKRIPLVLNARGACNGIRSTGAKMCTARVSQRSACSLLLADAHPLQRLQRAIGGSVSERVNNIAHAASESSHGGTTVQHPRFSIFRSSAAAAYPDGCLLFRGQLRTCAGPSVIQPASGNLLIQAPSLHAFLRSPPLSHIRTFANTVNTTHRFMQRGRGQDRGGGRGGFRGGSRGGPPSGSTGGRGSPGPGYGGRGSSPGGRGGYRGGDGGGFRGGDRGGYRGGPSSRGGSDRGSFGGRGRGRGEPAGVFAPGQPANIDARITDKSQDALITSLRSLKLSDTDLPGRPDFGTKGTAIKLRANFFPVKVPKGPLYEYDVALQPAASNKRLKRRIFQLAEETTEWRNAGMTGKVAHDHSAKLISCFKLPQPLEIKIAYTEEGEETAEKKRAPKQYVMAIKFIQPIETQALINYLEGQPQYRGYDIMPIINALNLVLSMHPSRVLGGGVMVGRNKFFHPSPTAPPVPLGGGLEAWRGFYSSVRPAWKQLMVNVNVCTTAFYTPGNLADRLIEFMSASHGARPAAFVKGVRIRTVHLGYRKTVKTAAKVNARQYKFTAEGMGEVTVEQYFAKKYNIKLRYPDLPLIDVGGQKTNYLPAEVCVILENQPFRGKLLDEHTATMITVACQPPNVNAREIVSRGIQELGFAQTAPPLNAFGVSIGNEMAVVPGRILPAPSVRYAGGGPTAIDDRASWNLRGVRFTVGARLEKWAVLLIQDGNRRDEFAGTNDPELQSTLSGFMDMCKRSGMTVDNAKPMVVAAQLPPRTADDPLRKRAIQKIRETLTSVTSKPKIILVMLSNGDRFIYSGLKHLCDVFLDVATVCVHAAKIRKERGQLQYFANVALKFNMKLGGVNHELGDQNMAWLTREPTMLVGMDVTHPGAGTVRSTPSIAAVVASVDKRMAQYPASLRLQESRKEMITDLQAMMEERLVAFRDRNQKNLPTRVLVYRDGVSEGQFETVLREEMPLIKKAFARFSTPQKRYNPKLTIVICAKRHHTRFFPTEAAHAAGDGNPRPGTVVDRGVTAVYDYDFFLQAHGGLQGTTRPTHYYVVRDEIGIGADQLQGLTNDISYTFARATKAVSLVSPAYYADLACERGRCYILSLLQGISDAVATTTAGSGTDEQEEVMKEAKKMWRFEKSPNGVGGALKETMFYI